MAISKRPKTGSGIDKIRALRESFTDSLTKGSTFDKIPASHGGSTGGGTGGGGKGKG